MIKGGRLPAVDGMAGAAILSKFAVVVIIFLMTGKTIGGRTLEDIINMAFYAFYFGVFAFQLES